MEKYRADIDGLRALAVTSVVLFHAGVKSVRGGYVGVDVFFVISGYLITRYVDQKLEGGRFSIVEFYERRVRRIMPALFFLLGSASILAYYSLLPRDLVNFSKSEIASTVFVPNILLCLEAGYFDAAAHLKPLIHMWSLGVEEQFYIFLPLGMVLISRWGRAWKLAALYGVFLASFLASVWAVRSHPTAAFYLVPFRAWELLLGSLIAVGAFPSIVSFRFRTALSAAGVLFVMASFFLYSPQTPFPGFAALLPCLGSALLIYGEEGGPTVTGRMLSSRLFVGIGLISYSLYLWHWPLLIFGEQALGRPLTGFETFVVVCLSVILATLSWRFVERPFRKRTLGSSRSSLFSAAAAAAAGLTVLAFVAIAQQGFPQRFSPQALRYASAAAERDAALSCKTSIESLHRGDFCLLGPAVTPSPQFVVWGDSHAAALAPAFRELAQETGSTGWLAADPGCSPLLGVVRVSRITFRCDQFNDAVVSAIERFNVANVFLVGRWNITLEESENRGPDFLRDSSSGELSREESERVLERGLGRSLARLAAGHRHVVLFLDVPIPGLDPPSFLAKSESRAGLGPEVRIDINENSGRRDSVDEILLRLSKEWHTPIIDPKLILCQGSRCLVAKDGLSLYRDDNHLSAFGALQLVALMRPAFEDGLPRSSPHAGVGLD